MSKTKIEKLDTLTMGGFLGGVDTVKYNKEDINFLHRALIYVYDKQVEIIDYLNQDQPEEEENKDWRRVAKKFMIVNDYRYYQAELEKLIEQEKQKSYEEGRREIIQLLKDKKKLEDWLEEKIKLTDK